VNFMDFRIVVPIVVLSKVNLAFSFFEPTPKTPVFLFPADFADKRRC